MSKSKKLTEGEGEGGGGGGGGGGEEEEGEGKSILNYNTTKLLKKLDYYSKQYCKISQMMSQIIEYLLGTSQMKP